MAYNLRFRGIGLHRGKDSRPMLLSHNKFRERSYNNMNKEYNDALRFVEKCDDYDYLYTLKRECEEKLWYLREEKLNTEKS